MKKIKSYFSSHKKILLTTLLLIVLLGSISFIIGSYATNVLTSGNDGEYNIYLHNEDNTISMPAHSAKTVYYKVENTTNGTVSYGVGYNISNYDPNDETDTSLGVYVKAYNSDDITGTLDYHEYKFIKLKIYNQTDNDDEVELSTILGYEEGGDLVMGDVNLIDDIISSEHSTLINNTTNQTNADSEFLNTGIIRKNIANLYISSDSLVSSNAIGYKVLDGTNELVAWWEENNNDSSLVDLYIGSDYGKVISPSNSSMLFAFLSNVVNMELSNLDMTRVTNIESTFRECSKMINAPELPEGITNMKYTFRNCKNISDFPEIPSTVIEMIYTFQNCDKMTEAPVIPNGVTNLQGTFQGCTGLTIAPVIPEGVTSMVNTFLGCRNLKSAPVIPSTVTNMHATFNGCSNLTGTIKIKSSNVATPTAMTLNPFVSTSKPITVEVPSGSNTYDSINTYKPDNVTVVEY